MNSHAADQAAEEMSVVVSEKGQITIPRRIRSRVGIRPGQILKVRDQLGEVILRKDTAVDAVDELSGSVDLGMTVEEYIALSRGPRDWT